MRFDFTKSAICRRFCKVRLLKHPTGMFYPLRMTRDGFILQYFSVSPLSVPASLRELFPPSPQEKAFCISFFAQEMKHVVYFCFQFPSILALLVERCSSTKPSSGRKVARLAVTEGACATLDLCLLYRNALSLSHPLG